MIYLIEQSNRIAWNEDIVLRITQEAQMSHLQQEEGMCSFFYVNLFYTKELPFSNTVFTTWCKVG